MNTGARNLYETLAQSRIFHEYEQAFSQSTDLTLRLIPAGGGERPTECASCPNRFCSLVAHHAAGRAACQQALADARQHLVKTSTPTPVRCFAGLAEVAVPVIAGSECAAILVAGQSFLSRPEQRDFCQLAKRLTRWGVNGEMPRLKEAYWQVPVIPKGKFDAAVRLVSLFAGQLADCARRWTLGRCGHDEPSPITRAKEFVQSQPGEWATLGAAAQHVHLSSDYFSKLFKQSSGMNFTEYVGRVHDENAKDMLLDPCKRVGEVAYDSGFESIPYFNRLFRRYAGMNPQQYRAAQRNHLGPNGNGHHAGQNGPNSLSPTISSPRRGNGSHRASAHANGKNGGSTNGH